MLLVPLLVGSELWLLRSIIATKTSILRTRRRHRWCDRNRGLGATTSDVGKATRSAEVGKYTEARWGYRLFHQT